MKVESKEVRVPVEVLTEFFLNHGEPHKTNIEYQIFVNPLEDDRQVTVKEIFINSDGESEEDIILCIPVACVEVFTNVLLKYARNETPKDFALERETKEMLISNKVYCFGCIESFIPEDEY